MILRREMCLNISKRYDELIKQSVKNEHMLADGLYYDERYAKELCKEMEDKEVFDAFGTLEFKEISKGKIKICAVASSSRIGFLYGMGNGIKGFEKKDVRNGICRPHYDNYDEKTNTFYEYKCHEFASDRLEHNCIINNPEGYKKLLSSHFFMGEDDIDCRDLFKSFGLEPCMFFDFKQFLCHVLGILSVASREVPAKLHYVMFVPKESILDEPANREIADWKEKLETNIKYIFEEMGEKKVRTCDGECGLFKDFIELNFMYQDVSEIKDFIYEKL